MYKKIIHYKDKQHFGDEVVVYQGEDNFFIVSTDRGILSCFFIDLRLTRLYPVALNLNFDIKHCPDQLDYDFDIDLNIRGYGTCPECYKVLIKAHQDCASIQTITTEVEVENYKHKMYGYKTPRWLRLFCLFTGLALIGFYSWYSNIIINHDLWVGHMIIPLISFGFGELLENFVFPHFKKFSCQRTMCRLTAWIATIIFFVSYSAIVLIIYR